MSRSNYVKYQFAKNNNNEIIKIEDLQNDDECRKEIYHCVSCNQLLVPVLGNIRQKHFRHQIEVVCNPETYLHNLGKELFYSIYSRCLEFDFPFHIEIFEKIICSQCKKDFDLICDLGQKLMKYDLTKYYTQISIESPDGDFIPDVLLSSKEGNKLYFEFVVTHESTEKKRGSGIKIIELSLDSENDLLSIPKRLFSEENKKIRFFNFKPTEHRTKDSYSCTQQFPFFLLKKDGGASIQRKNPKYVKHKMEKSDFQLIKLLPTGGVAIYFQELVNSYNIGLNVRSCFLCRYHAMNQYRWDDDLPIFCKFLKSSYISTRAVNCQYFRADPKVFQKL